MVSIVKPGFHCNRGQREKRKKESSPVGFKYPDRRGLLKDSIAKNVSKRYKLQTTLPRWSQEKERGRDIDQQVGMKGWFLRGGGEQWVFGEEGGCNATEGGEAAGRRSCTGLAGRARRRIRRPGAGGKKKKSEGFSGAYVCLRGAAERGILIGMLGRKSR